MREGAIVSGHSRLRAGWYAVSFACLIICAGTACAWQEEKFLVVVSPVADIRRIPREGLGGLAHDDLNETQALYNEALRYKGENAGWYQVEALEQKEYTHHKLWQGYPGWIRKDKAVFTRRLTESDLVVVSRYARIIKIPAATPPAQVFVPLGTRLKEAGRKEGYYKVRLPGGSLGWVADTEAARIGAPANEDQKRLAVVKEARLFLGAPYLWGGRSPSGVDCSGLVNLAYRSSGIDIPRDAHEQWMRATPIPADELKPGDLIFLSKKGDPKAIVHVMLSLGRDEFIEAPGTGKSVRIGRLKEYAGSGKTVYFGRILQ